MKRSILLAAVGVLAACTAVTDVSSRRDGHLTVTSRARWNIVPWNRVKNAGMKQAQGWCSKHDKTMHAVGVHTEGVRGVTRQTVEVVFDCF